MTCFGTNDRFLSLALFDPTIHGEIIVGHIYRHSDAEQVTTNNNG